MVRSPSSPVRGSTVHSAARWRIQWTCRRARSIRSRGICTSPQWVFPQGHRLRVSVSNALWPMNWPTPYSMTTALRLGGTDASSIVLPACPSMGRRRPRLRRPSLSKSRRESGRSAAMPPGRANGRCCAMRCTNAARWCGRARSPSPYPWGRFDHSERLTYDVDDAHPDVARVQGDSEYVQAVKDHTLTWRGRLDVSSDAHTFF